jgi:GT2 family glycosyltransferase
MIEYHPFVDLKNYVAGQHDELLAPDADAPSGPNIGAAGHNLTITFLSLGRVALSLRLCDSIVEKIPEFAGEVLVVDNGSDEADLQTLQAALSHYPFRSRIIPLHTNVGISAGRNIAVKEAKTDWVLSLDNDVYFVRDPIRLIQRDLAKLGAKFASLPILELDQGTLYAFGGHLAASVDDVGRLTVGCFGSATGQKVGIVDMPCFLGTYLTGGTAIIEKQTFEKLGGFDEAIFVGLEDLEFSIRLFQAGLKVGCFGFTALVHDHAIATNENERKYEKIRFSKKTIYASARHIEKKYGLSAWSQDIGSWIDNQAAAQGLVTERTTDYREPLAIHRRSRPKIALVVDHDSRAFANIARALHRYLSDEFSFDIIVRNSLDCDEQVLFFVEQHDIVHFFWSGLLSSLLASCTNSSTYAGRPVSQIFASAFASNAITTSIYSHQSLDRQGVENFAKVLDVCAGYYVSSSRLFKIYSELNNVRSPHSILPDGVDTTIFRPKRRSSAGTAEELTIGWTGNSRRDALDNNGLHSIVVPAVDELRAEGFKVRLKLVDRDVAPIPHARMPEFYNSIDACVCGSLAEGTPDPVLEAMACGVPVISTDVGIVPDVFGSAQRAFILQERSISALKDAIRRLYDDRRQIAELAAENLTSIAPWDWSKKADAFRTFFREALESGRRRAQ